MSRRRLWLVLLALMAIGAVAAGIAAAGKGNDNNKTFEYSVGLWGDLPYNDVQAQTGVPNLIADMNNSDISFSIHDGDLKAGSGTPGSSTPTTCSDALYDQSINYLNSLQQPAFFTPGDNDWTDCDRPANGSFNELERLQRERQLLFIRAAVARPTPAATRRSTTPARRLTSSGSSRRSTRRRPTTPPA